MCTSDKSKPSLLDYRPLGEDEIRLLTITSQNSLTLEHARIAENPEYIAISYEWGVCKDLGFLYVDGREIKVSRTVCDLIRRMFNKYNQTRIWLDYICIDQLKDEDDEEKKQQLKLMSRIYSTALSVHAWLGESTKKTDIVFGALLEFEQKKRDLAQSILDSGLDSARELSYWHELFDNIYQRHARDATDLSDDDDPQDEDNPQIQPELNWLRPVFSNSYWLRLWIVQELVLAKTVIVFCGDKFINFDAIYGLSADEGSFEQAFELGLLQRMKSKGWVAMQTIRGHRYGLKCGHSDCDGRLICECIATIEQVVQIYAGNHECKRKHDKVYGLRALVFEWGGFKMDYEKPLLEVFQDATNFARGDQHTAVKLFQSMGLHNLDIPEARAMAEFVAVKKVEEEQALSRLTPDEQVLKAQFPGLSEERLKTLISKSHRM